MTGAIRFLVNCSVVNAFSTLLPLIRSSTSRAFWGETRVNCAFALNSMMYVLYPFGAGAAGAAGEMAPGPPGTPAGLAAVSVAARTECPLNWRGNENSPRFCPPMFSGVYNGVDFFPLFTPPRVPAPPGGNLER